MLALTRMNDRLLTPEYASPNRFSAARSRPPATFMRSASFYMSCSPGCGRTPCPPRPASSSWNVPFVSATRNARARRSRKRSTRHGRARVSRRSRLLRWLAACSRIDCRNVCSATSTPSSCARCARSRSIAMARSNSWPPTCVVTCRAEPVVARQGNWLYYSQRFVSRHAFGVSAGAVLHRRHRRIRRRDVVSEPAHRRRA